MCADAVISHTVLTVTYRMEQVVGLMRHVYSTFAVAFVACRPTLQWRYTEKNTHSHFLLYLHELCVDLNKN